MNTVSFINSVKNLLEKNNTTTSSTDVSSSLNNRAKTFKAGVNNMSIIAPVAKTQYPAVFVELNNKPQQFGLIGNTAKRDQQISFSVVCVTEYNSGAGEYESACQESIQLADNVEILFRNKIRLSQTSITLDANAISTEYGTRLEDSYSNYVSKIDIVAKVWDT